MKTFARRLAYLLAAVAAIYLIAVNTALNLPATRTLLNDLQPDSLHVDWRRAWSLYPLRVSVSGVAADGQTRTEQWQLDAERVAVSVSLLPLLNGEIRIHDIDLIDIDLRLRPRPLPAKPAAAGADPAAAVALSSFYPVIRNRDPDAIAEPPPEVEPEAPDLVLAIDDLHVRGDHSFWVSHVRGSLPGEVRGSFEIDTDSGRVALSGGALDLSLASLTIGPAQPVSGAASIKGTVDIPPFVMSETEGLALLRLPTLDASVNLPVENLDFLAILMPPLRAMALTGAGQLRGRLRLDAGEVRSGTDLTVEARRLAMDLGRFNFRGDGSVEFAVDPETESAADLIVRFDQVQALLERPAGGDAANAEPLFNGKGLEARLHAAEVDPNTTSTADQAAEMIDEVDLALTLSIPTMQAPDLSVYQGLLPAKWGLGLLGGSGEVQGRLELTDDVLQLTLDLTSDEARVEYASYRATTDLLLALRARVEDRNGATLDMSGTRFRLDNAEVVTTDASTAEAEPIAPWSAELAIDRAELSLPADASETETIRAVVRTLGDQGFGALLGSANGLIDARFTVNRLDWIAALMHRPMGLRLDGGGEIDTDIRLNDGWPAKGSSLQIPRKRLSMALLDHRIDGQGEAGLTLVDGGKQPRVRLAVAFDDARLRRRDEPEPSIGEVRMDATLEVGDLDDAAATAALALRIHSARVHDMSTYNAYLPPGLPLTIRSGEASLVSDLQLAPDSAQGELELVADDIRLGLNEADVAGDLRIALLIRDGSSRDLHFDITGSSIQLKGFQVQGATAASNDATWYARLQLDDTRVRWQKPMHIDTKAQIVIKDTRPFLALMDNLRGKQGWVEDMLTIEDLAGQLHLRVDGERALLESARVSGPEIGVHAKGQAAGDRREALVLLRWHNLMGTLRIANDDKSFSIVNPRARFDAYRPGQGAVTATAAPTGASAPARARRPAPAAAAKPSKPAQPPRDQGPDSDPFLDHSL